MRTEILYQHLNHKIPFIQSLAIKLTGDFETARFLYQETAHQAIKNKHQLQEETLEKWLTATMNRAYAKIVRTN